MTKKLFFIFLIFGIVGLGDASYLTIQHYAGTSLVCSVFNGCDRVTSSVYATWGSIPVALVGIVYYAGILVTAALAFWKSKKYLLFTMGITTLGFLGSLWFVYLQFFVLNALCTYCLLSALITFVLFGMSVKKIFFRKKEIVSSFD